jgi:Kef-type K+ transport system membrane component KefB
MGAVRDMYLCSAPLHCREIHRRVCGAICGEKVSGENQQIANTLMTFLIICMYASAWVTSMFGIEAIIGSFMFGLIVTRSSRIFQVCTERLEVFVHVIMLPLYFAQSGLSTDFTVLQSYPDLPLLIAVIAVATLGKVLGAGIPSYLLGIPLRVSAIIAVLMNTRGLVELIVLNIGLNQGECWTSECFRSW